MGLGRSKRSDLRRINQGQKKIKYVSNILSGYYYKKTELGTKAARSQLCIISSVSVSFTLIMYPIGYNLKLATIATLQYSLNVAFTIEDFSTQLAVRQNAVVAITPCRSNSVRHPIAVDSHLPSLRHLWRCGQVLRIDRAPTRVCA